MPPYTASSSLVFTPQIIKHASSSLSNILERAGDSIPNMRKERIAEAIGKRRVKTLASKMGISPSAIYQWLKGDTKNLKLEYLFALASETGYRAEWIATGKGDKIEATSRTSEPCDLSFLTVTITAVEKYLDQEDLSLPPEAKAKLISLLYDVCSQRGKVDEPSVARYLRLVA